LLLSKGGVGDGDAGVGDRTTSPGDGLSETEVMDQMRAAKVRETRLKDAFNGFDLNADAVVSGD